MGLAAISSSKKHLDEQKTWHSSHTLEPKQWESIPTSNPKDLQQKKKEMKMESCNHALQEFTG